MKTKNLNKAIKMSVSKNFAVLLYEEDKETKRLRFKGTVFCYNDKQSQQVHSIFNSTTLSFCNGAIELKKIKIFRSV